MSGLSRLMALGEMVGVTCSVCCGMTCVQMSPDVAVMPAGAGAARLGPASWVA